MEKCDPMTLDTNQTKLLYVSPVNAEVKSAAFHVLNAPMIASSSDDNCESGQATKGIFHRNAHKSEDLSYEFNDGMDLMNVPWQCADQVEQFTKYVWKTGWRAMPHHALPKWMKDNEFLLKGHRPPLPSVKACLASIFRLHTETVNIWTHLIGCILFIVWALQFLLLPSSQAKSIDKLMFGSFFFGAISCLCCSTIFHIFSCHSCKVCKLFNKIDYCGISLLIIGSFFPWLYYAFYCRYVERLVYFVLITFLGLICIIVSLWDKFSDPEYRVMRAGMFIAFGLSALIPCGHHMALYGPAYSFNYASLNWLILMGTLYICGALLYAARVPERFFPGKCDILGQSHQLFHVLVVIAASTHYYGITLLAINHSREYCDCAPSSIISSS